MAVRKRLENKRPLADIRAEIKALSAQRVAIQEERHRDMQWVRDECAASPGWDALPPMEKMLAQAKAEQRQANEGDYDARIRALYKAEKPLIRERNKHPDLGASLMIYLTQGELAHLAAFAEGKDFHHRDLAAEIVRKWLREHPQPQ